MSVNCVAQMATMNEPIHVKFGACGFSSCSTEIWSQKCWNVKKNFSTLWLLKYTTYRPIPWQTLFFSWHLFWPECLLTWYDTQIIYASASNLMLMLFTILPQTDFITLFNYLQCHVLFPIHLKRQHQFHRFHL